MKLLDLFPEERVQVGLSVSNRRQLLEHLAGRVHELGLVDRGLCLKALSDREALGSTGLGHGVAIPHARIAGLDQAVGMCVTLERPIDFEAADQEPVDVVFMLLMPEQSASEQMKVLSTVARIARQEPIINALRRAASTDEVLDILADREA